MREANLASMPLDLSSSSEIVNKEHSLLSTFAGLQTGNKDWPPTDDAKTCPPLKTKAQLTLWINRARSYHYKKRLECFTEFGVGEKLLEPETTMAQKPDLSSGKKNNVSKLLVYKGRVSKGCKFSTPDIFSCTMMDLPFSIINVFANHPAESCRINNSSVRNWVSQSQHSHPWLLLCG